MTHAISNETAASADVMAESLIYATAQLHGAAVWTQDDDFKDLPGVKYFAKPATNARKPLAK